MNDVMTAEAANKLADDLPSRQEIMAAIPMAVSLPEQPGTLLSAIVTMACDPKVDVAKLDALLKMQERLEERQAEREFAAAYSRLSAKLPRIKKEGTIDLGKDDKGKARGAIPFARWEDIDKIIRPLMAEEGFSLLFTSLQRAETGGGLIVTGTLMHRDGHSRSASMPLPLDTGPGRNNLQAGGSTLSYGKRYCAEMLLNIVREGADDDGRAGGAKRITPDQLAELRRLMVDTQTEDARFCQMFGVADLANLEQGTAYTGALNMLTLKREQQRAKTA